MRKKLELDTGIDILGDIIENSGTDTPHAQFYGLHGLHNMGHRVIAFSHDPLGEYRVISMHYISRTPSLPIINIFNLLPGKRWTYGRHFHSNERSNVLPMAQIHRPHVHPVQEYIATLST